MSDSLAGLEKIIPPDGSEESPYVCGEEPCRLEVKPGQKFAARGWDPTSGPDTCAVIGEPGSFLAAEMRSGTVSVSGDCRSVGAYAGYRMCGGHLDIDANTVGDYVGAFMCAGEIHVSCGNAPRYVGFHMSGGTIYIHGDIGDWAGLFAVDGEVVFDRKVHGDHGNLGVAHRAS